MHIQVPFCDKSFSEVIFSKTRFQFRTKLILTVGNTHFSKWFNFWITSQCSWYSLRKYFWSSSPMDTFILLVLYSVHFEFYWYYFTRYQLSVKLTLRICNLAILCERFCSNFLFWQHFSFILQFFIEQNKPLKVALEN